MGWLQQAGFTLIELMVTIAVAAILVMLSTGVGNLVVENRRASALNDVLAAINYARNEAISRGVNVTICRSADQAACGGGSGWENGWIVFTDLNANGVVEAGDIVAPNTTAVLKVHNSLPAKVTLRGVGGNTVVDRITFNALGSSPGFVDSLTLCDSRGFGSAANFYARYIAITAGGRVSNLIPTAAGSCT